MLKIVIENDFFLYIKFLLRSTVIKNNRKIFEKFDNGL